MSDPKRHHYVAQMHLRNFTDSNGRLHYHDKRADDTVRSASPDSVFFEKHLYSFTEPADTRNAKLEKEFSRIESAVKVLFDRVLASVREQTAPSLTEDEKQGIEQYFYYQWKRVPDFHAKIATINGLDALLPKFIEQLEQSRGALLTAEERQSITSEAGRKQIFERARAQAIADPGEEVLKVIRKVGGLKFGLVTSPAELAIGSHPVVAVRHPRHQPYEVWLPIAFDVGLALTQLRGPATVFFADADDAARINAASFAQSNLVAGRSPSVIEGLVNAGPS